MSRQKTPCCYKTGRIIFLDDNHKFLEGLKVVLPSHCYYNTYLSPYELIQYFKDDYDPNVYFKGALEVGDDDVIDDSSVNVNIKAIYEEIYNPNRFDEISVMAIDYAMPGINGIEVCRKLSNFPNRKILLTGEAGHDLAVKAFNEEIIQQFILKGPSTWDQELVQAVIAQQKAYYTDLSELITNSLAHSASGKLACLQDKAFASLFNKICEDNDIVEYYLTDVYGTFLMLDKDANAVWLIVNDDENLKDYALIAADNYAPAEIVDPLKEKTKVPYFFSEEDFDTAPSDWGPYLHPAQVLDGEKRYYYAIVKGTDLYKLDQDRIVSYQSFLDDHEA